MPEEKDLLLKEKSTLIRFAIIGCAGRFTHEQNKLNELHMKWMKDNVHVYIKYVIKTDPENIILVSGGSAWADHVAIQLYLTGEFRGLHLYLPSNFNYQQKKFYNTTEGFRLNALHRIASNKLGINTLNELYMARGSSVNIEVKNGFHARNTLIATKCDYMMAFTFNGIDDSDVPADGGTKDTWDKCLHGNKIHLSLDMAS